MEMQDCGDGKLIVLSKAFDTRPKILNIIYFIVFTATSVSIALFATHVFYLTIGSFLFFAAGIIIYLTAAYRFLNKALQSEKLTVNKTSITIIKDGFLSKKETIYNADLISAFRHLDKPEQPRHILSGQSFDYLGFQTRNKSLTICMAMTDLLSTIMKEP